jgi:excisionase family DNA binding protein
MTTREHSSELLTVAEVAERLHCSKPTVRRCIRDGELPAVRLGGAGSAVRIPARALEAWLKERAMRSPTPSPAPGSRVSGVGQIAREQPPE